MESYTRTNQLTLAFTLFTLGLLTSGLIYSAAPENSKWWYHLSSDLEFHLTEADELLSSSFSNGDLKGNRALIEVNLLEAYAHISILANGGTAHGIYVPPLDSGDAVKELKHLAEKINKLLELTVLTEVEGESVPFHKYDWHFNDLLDLSKAILADYSRITEIIVAREQAKRKTLLTVIVVAAILIVISIFYSFSAARKSSKQVREKNKEINGIINDLNVLQYAFDQHSIVAVTDASGKITRVNEKFCELSGYSKSELLGNDHRIINSGYHTKQFFSDMWEKISSGVIWHGEILNKAKEGGFYWVDTTIVPIKDPAGDLTAYVSIRTDISKRKKYETELAESEIRLSRQNKALISLAMKEFSDIKNLSEAVVFYTETLANTLRPSKVSVWMFNRDHSGLECQDMFLYNTRKHQRAEEIDFSTYPNVISMLETERLIVRTNVESDEFSVALSDSYKDSSNVSSFMIATIRVNKHTVGIVMLEQLNEQRDWTLDEKNFCASAATFIATLIETADKNRIEQGIRVIAKTAATEGAIFKELALQISKGLSGMFVSIGSLTDDGMHVNTIAAWRANRFIKNHKYELTSPIEDNVTIRFVNEEIATKELGIEDYKKSDVVNRYYISAPIHDEEQKISGVISVVSSFGIHNQDLAGHMLRLCSSRISSELEKMKARARLTSIVDSVSDFILEMDSSGLITYCSEKITTILGFESEEVEQRSIYILIDENDVDGGGSEFYEHFHSGSVLRNFELWVKGKQRNRVCLLCNLEPLYNEEVRLVGYRGVFSDITNRKEYEARNNLLATAINQSVDGVIIAKVDGAIEYVNNAFSKIIGRDESEAVGKDVLDIGLFSSENEFKQNFISEFKSGNKWLGRGSNKTAKGESIQEEIILTPIYSSKNELVKVVVGVRDITKEAILEEQSRRSQKMQAIGTLAGGIAHDFNNILSAILGFADLTLEDLPEESAHHDNITQVVNAAFRAKSLVQQILDFSRQSAQELQAIMPSSMTKEVLKLLRASISSSISIEENIGAQDVYIKMDPTQYHQVVMNLVVNAGSAIGDSNGTITVSLDTYTPETSNQTIKQGEYVRLMVKDTGCGMSDEIKERVFEPFFTTKEVDEGSGMGLAAVHGIIKAQKGYIEVDSVPGKGSCFEVFIPIARQEKLQLGKTEEVPRQVNEHVLVVDDEEVQTAMMHQMLTKRGYHVTTCTRSKMALEIFTRNPNEFDVVIVDQNMPELTGDVLAREMLKMRPDLPIVMCTGYSQSVGPEEAKEIGIQEYVMKPITIQDLTTVLARILDAKQ